MLVRVGGPGARVVGGGVVEPGVGAVVEGVGGGVRDLLARQLWAERTENLVTQKVRRVHGVSRFIEETAAQRRQAHMY